MSDYISRDPSIADVGDGTPTGAIRHLADNMASIDSIYPVGSIYISINNVNPSTFLGGTWVAVDIFVSGSSDTTTYAFKRTA